jgi:2'-5' RNA ligase
MSNFGYIQVEFGDEFKEELSEWSKKSIDQKYLIYSEINGETIGGLVTHDAHITLVYGIQLNSKHSEEIQKEVQKIKLSQIKISGIKCFILKQFGAKILYLSIDDANDVLEQIHEKFKKFISEEIRQNQPPFVPHIAIAYVSEDFDEQTLIYGGPSEIQVVNVRFYQGGDYE